MCKVIRNAIAYVLRRRYRTFIILIILTLVLTCIHVCLSIKKSSDNLERSLYKTSNSSLSITGKENQGAFEIDRFKSLKKINGIKEIVPEYDGLARLSDSNVIESNQKVKRDDLPGDLKNIVSVQLTSNSERSLLFNSGVFTMQKGRHLRKNDVNKVLVHSEFAKKNNLKLHDKVSLGFLSENRTDSNAGNREFEIVGIFSGKKQEKHTGLSSDLSENTMFADYDSGQRAMNPAGNSRIANKLSIFTDSPENMNTVMKRIKKLDIEWQKYKVEKDTSAFKEAIASLASIKHIIRIMTYSIMIGGLIVLSLILILWLRERIYEIGILLSIGINKAKIMAQFISELALISMPAAIISLVLGNAVFKKVIGGFAGADGNASITSSFIENESIGDNLLTFVQSYGLLLLIIVISVAATSGIILVKKPKEILSKIS